MCGKKGHFKGAASCKKGSKGGDRREKKESNKEKNKEKDKKKVKRLEDDSADSSSSDREDSSSSDDDEYKSTSRIQLEKSKRISQARYVAHVRRASVKEKKKQSRYLVEVIVKEKLVTFFADTGAEISVIPKSLAKELNIPLQKTRMRIKPYGTTKRVKCVGFYVGALRYKDEVANVGIYVVNKEAEPLLSGAASEALGIITFNGKNIEQDVNMVVGDNDSDTARLEAEFPSAFKGVLRSA